MKELKAKAKALKIAELASAKKAKDLVVLDISKVSGLCDYFVICSADSARQAKAICDDVIKKCRKDKIKVQHSENDDMSNWILIDFFDVILHIFQEEARGFYNLEYLWSSAKKISLKKNK